MTYDPGWKYKVLGKLLNANMNSVADQAIALGAAKAIVTDIVVTNPSLSMTLAAGGFYSAAGKTGLILVPATQLYSGLLGVASDVVTPVVTRKRITTGQIFFALTTAQGVAATADIYVLGIEADQ